MTTLLGTPQISQALLQDLDRVGRRHSRWTPAAYFELSGAYLVEYSRGNLEILPMPTMLHQRIASRLYDALRAAVSRDGEVFFAGTRVRVGPDTYREPDVLYIPEEWGSAIHDEFTERAAVVMEVVSESNRDHDLTTKRREYARAGIPEYWIVDPQTSRILVLKLEDSEYAVHGEFGPGDRAASEFIAGFGVSVSDIFGTPK